MPPVIVINKKYSLTSDLNQFIIIESGRMIKFFQRLESAVDWLIRAKIKNSNLKSLEQVSFLIKRESESLQQLVTSRGFGDKIRMIVEDEEQ